MLKNFKPISLILLAGATCFPASIFAETMPSKQGMNISQQNGKVTGTVVDDLGPVAGASVVVKGTTNGNITDMDGNFTLEGVKNGDIIQISFIGYINPAKRKAMVAKNEKRFLKQKRNVLQKSESLSFRSDYPVKIQASFKRLLKAV